MRKRLPIGLLLMCLGTNGGTTAEIQCRPGGPLAGVEGYDFYTQTEPLYARGIEYYQPNHAPCYTMFDKQSQGRLWTAPELPIAPSARLEQVRVPKVRQYRGPGPFPVVRCGVKSPIITLGCGELPVSLYAIRVIATVDQSKLRPFREPIYLGVRVNDRIDGAVPAIRTRTHSTCTCTRAGWPP